MKKAQIAIMSALSVGLLLANMAAATVVFDNQSGLIGNQTDAGPWIFAEQFIVNSDGEVTSMGAFDDSGDGYGANVIPVAIYEKVGAVWNQVPGTLTTFTGVEGTLIGQSRFKTLGVPVLLDPGTYAVVSANWGPATERNYNSAAGGSPLYSFNSVGGLLSLVGGDYLGMYQNGSAALPADGWTGGDGSGPYYFGAGTFGFDVQVPEPSQFASAAAALLGLFSLGRGFLMRRRQPMAVA